MVQQVWRQWPQIHPLNYHILHWIQPRWSPHHGLYTWQVWEPNSLNRVLRQLLFNCTQVLQNVTTCLIQLGYFMRVPIKFLVVFKKVTLCHLRIPNYIFRDFGVARLIANFTNFRPWDSVMIPSWTDTFNCAETHSKLDGEVGAYLWLPLLTSIQLSLAVVMS